MHMEKHILYAKVLFLWDLMLFKVHQHESSLSFLSKNASLLVSL